MRKKKKKKFHWFFLGGGSSVVRSNTVAGIINFFVDHTRTQFTEESKMATALTPQTDVTSGKVTWLMENPRL